MEVFVELRMGRAYLYLIFISLVLHSWAQETPKHAYDNMLWAGYYNSLSLNEKWSVNSDFQFRTKDWYKTPSQGLGRVGISYKLDPKLNVTVGLAHFRFFLNDVVTRGEWRPWQEIGLSDRIGKFKISNRLRIEQRFNETNDNNGPTGQYRFNWRFRYKLDIQYPEEGKFSVGLGNEIMLNAGKNITVNYFDQNRTYGSLNANLTKNISLQFQFMYIWQLLQNGQTLDHINVIRFNIIHRIKV